MQAVGEVDPGLDPDRAAAALLAGIQGGVAVLLATGDLTHLEAALDVGIESLGRTGSGVRPGALTHVHASLAGGQQRRLQQRCPATVKP
jgi:hypothetical protein